MCGIVGLVIKHDLLSNDIFALNTAIKSLDHRGPDANGSFIQGRVGLGHVRLSILDLSSAGAQPMISANGRYVISYNGEIYNYKELAKKYDLTGLCSHSDTEVILELFSKIGAALFSQMNGMFSLAIYDRFDSKVWLARDRMGIKPLYFTKNEFGIYFSSEIKAIRYFSSDLNRVNFSGLAEWCYYGTTLGDKSLFDSVTKVLPGHYLTIDVPTLSINSFEYWNPTFANTVVQGDLVEQTRNLLEQAVTRQLVSDVPVGIFLSGGIDSSAITAFASRHYSGRLSTYSAGFDYDGGVNELASASALSKQYGTDHHEIHVSGFDVGDIVEKMILHHDQPFSDAANIPLYLMSKELRGKSKVILQGDGGDELFGGYQRYKSLTWLNFISPLAHIGQVVNKFAPVNTEYYRRARYLAALTTRPNWKLMALLLTVETEKSPPTAIFQSNILQRMVNDPFKRYRDCFDLINRKFPVDQMLLLDSMIILPDVFLEKVDKATMAASIEVRVPFLDNDLVNFCLSLNASDKIPKGKQKFLLKNSLRGVVPDRILDGKKTGFGVPFSFWLKGALKGLFFDHMDRFVKMNPQVLDKQYVSSLFKDHLDGKRDNGFILWKVMNLMIWSNHYQMTWDATN